MKKEYIAPEVAVRSIDIENAFCLNASDTEGDGNQLSKEYDDEEGYWD